jgi:endonuclease/exonuclease/phosphatase family metal-dependent hydrolase
MAMDGLAIAQLFHDERERIMKTANLVRWVVAMAIVVGLGACGGIAPDELGSEGLPPAGAGGKADDPGPDQDNAAPFSFVTYNAGLAHGAVALAAERLPEITAALQQVDADVVCLQEVWTDDDAHAITSALAAKYPRAFRERTEDHSPKTTPCGMWSTYQLDRCVGKSCTPQGISADECVRTACKDRYDALEDDCKLCLAANTASAWRCAFLGARSFANEGRNGLLLLSRHPIERPAYTPFDTVLVKRGVITATVQGHDVHCTHLSSDLDVVPYPKQSRFASWTEEQAEQIKVIDSLSTPGTCTVVLGDLNAGLAASGLTAELPQNFSQLLALGYQEPWTAPSCTWCKDNPLAGAKAALQLDHVMFNDCPLASYNYSRILDQPISLQSEGAVHQTRLSDHYGLRVEMTPVRTE